jgi:hypothetical protein
MLIEAYYCYFQNLTSGFKNAGFVWFSLDTGNAIKAM